MRILQLTSLGDEIDIAIDDESSSQDSSTVDTPTTYSGGAYYTPELTDTPFYAPWGDAPLETGLNYFTITIGAVGVVAFLAFVMPYAIDVIKGVIEDFQRGMK